MKREFSLTLDGVTYEIAVDGNTILVNGQPFVAGFEGDQVLIDGIPYNIALEDDKAVVNGIAYDIAMEGLEKGESARPAARAVPASEGAVTAIMPGKIIRVLVKQGDQVAEGEVICILEAMKMENELKSPRTGTVKALHVQAGQDVEMGAVLAEIE